MMALFYLSKVKFILKLVVAKGFSFKDATIASVFAICCNDDYAWLARRSRRTISYLIRSLKQRYGASIYTRIHQLNKNPEVAAAAYKAWRDCNLHYPPRRKSCT